MINSVISLTLTSMMIYSKVNLQVNSEYLMFNISYLSKSGDYGHNFLILKVRIDVFYKKEQ